MNYILYCDESANEGKAYGNFYGGALLNANKFYEIENSLNKRKEELKLNGEIKWSKTTENYLEKYISIIDLYFYYIEKNLIKIRIMFTKNCYEAVGLTKEQLNEGFQILYYYFIKKAFGLQYIQPKNHDYNLIINFDKLPDTKEKNDKFKKIVTKICNTPGYENILIKPDNIHEVDSKKHVILQCMDIILGSMNFRLNDMHKVKPCDSRTRGKRTIAKEKLYKHINKRIRKIYPGFNIGISTGYKTDKDIWEHAYRHWCFIPSNHNYNHLKTKKEMNNKKSPTSPT